jgi:hypothetical protein
MRQDFGLQSFGYVGGLIYSLVVAASCLGALNTNVFATGRLCVAASKQVSFLKSLATAIAPPKKKT